jgi:molybdopterin-guanine dinucleotide biosynthesis protein MobB
MIPVIIFAAGSDTGKTTLMEAVILELKKRGRKVAAVKHTSHQVKYDREGTDSWRFSEAGAEVTVLASPGGLGIFRNNAGEVPLNTIVEENITGVDIVLVEGYKEMPYPKLVISRSSNHDDVTCTGDIHIVGFITDHPVETELPVLPINEPHLVADFIEEQFL